jgi:hypothetical protein
VAISGGAVREGANFGRCSERRCQIPAVQREEVPNSGDAVRKLPPPACGTQMPTKTHVPSTALRALRRAASPLGAVNAARGRQRRRAEPFGPSADPSTDSLVGEGL